MMYHLGGDRRYLERAWHDLQAGAAFPDWHPFHWLDTAEMTAAFALGYDWFTRGGTDVQRAVLRRRCSSKGLRVALDTYENRKKYGWQAHVANPAPGTRCCNGGTGRGAWRWPRRSPSWPGSCCGTWSAIDALAMVQFAPDGAFEC